MADYYRSPSASVQPSSEGGAPELSPMARLGLQKSRGKAATTTFDKQRNNDRSAIKGYIYKRMDQKDMPQASEDKTKFDILKELWEIKTLDREHQGNASARLIFPNSHSEQDEDRWLQRTFGTYLDKRVGKGHDEDLDDPEDLHVRTRIKQEQVVHYREDSDAETDFGEDENEEGMDEAEEEPEDKYSCNPISSRVARAIELKSTAMERAIGGAASLSTTKQEAKLEMNTADVRAAKPYWKWVNMKLMVCRPSEDSGKKGEVAGSGQKRKLGDTENLITAKKAKA